MFNRKNQRKIAAVICGILDPGYDRQSVTIHILIQVYYLCKCGAGAEAL